MREDHSQDRSGIKAIIFDVGGVLIDLDMPACKAAFHQVLDYKHTEEMLDPCHGKGLYMQIEAGNMSAEEYRKAILAESKPGCTEEMVDQAMWALLKGIMPEKVETLKVLAKKYDLYLLSNNNSINWLKCQHLLEDAGLSPDHFFQKSFVSYQLKMLKPSPEIFGRIIHDIHEEKGYEADEMLFIDDSTTNVAAAVESGLQAMHYVQGTDMAAQLSEVLDGR